MAADTSGASPGRGEGTPFPRIRISVTGDRRRRHFVLGPVIQAVALLVLLCGAVGLGTLGARWVSAPRRIAHQDKAAVRTEIANADLQDAVARLQDSLAKEADTRTALETRLAALAGRAAALRGRLAAAQAKLQASRNPPIQQPAANSDRVAALRQALARIQGEVHALKAESATLAARVSKTEADRSDQSARNRRTEASLVAATRPGGRQ